MLILEVASLLASLLLFYYTYRVYSVFSDTKLQSAMQLLLNGFLLLVVKAAVAIMNEYGLLAITFQGGEGDLPGLISLIAYIIIIAAMVRLRRVFLEFEVQKKAIVMLRTVFEGKRPPSRRNR